MSWTEAEWALLRAMQADIAETRSEMRELRVELMGNGEIGLCEQVRKLCSDVETARADAARQRRAGRWRQRAIYVLSGCMLLMMAYHVGSGEWHSVPALLRALTLGLL